MNMLAHLTMFWITNIDIKLFEECSQQQTHTYQTHCSTVML